MPNKNQKKSFTPVAPAIRTSPFTNLTNNLSQQQQANNLLLSQQQQQLSLLQQQQQLQYSEYPAFASPLNGTARYERVNNDSFFYNKICYL